MYRFFNLLYDSTNTVLDSALLTRTRQAVHALITFVYFFLLLSTN